MCRRAPSFEREAGDSVGVGWWVPLVDAVGDSKGRDSSRSVGIVIALGERRLKKSVRCLLSCKHHHKPVQVVSCEVVASRMWRSLHTFYPVTFHSDFRPFLCTYACLGADS